ncbi:PREDICTED: proton-coupled folate transporter [Nicrophorus vespilloides]|uniref:Proton-coupled folate transporter n=1 Tax=Nicrophorus vespilloides TaxID=110193 RepID=A0ABM1NHD1_NICVS|nr:PREDICTED: proton-coupled folate transporter [Nicrophorus vespilloides]XP_017786231.1 PREDICTED: proton-coupled folate transporter [Nicrophorus vespilloides]XP_017786232.1 PREDICTED: proton-coupled folate transporter [Nicrophorus vespilloides]XP_017786233.1 PREDICTED: proton-coupled folate transporter [Nicrophorus vespilloides]
MPVKQWLLLVVEWVRLISVEPTMMLYMMAFMLTSVVEQALFVDKACRSNHNFTAEICDNLNAYEDQKKIVQVTVSEFHQWNDIAGHVVPIFLALFMGAWSDKRGRKIPLLLGLIGKFIYSGMVVVNTLKPDWNVEYIIYTATIPMAFTGADVAIFAAAFSYLSDVSSSDSRTLRVTILEVCYLATMPTGIALGSYLFTQVTNRSYTIMFSINASLLLLSILYTSIFLKWRTNDRQRPLSEASNVITDFFDWNHVIETFRTLLKKRPENKRSYLILLILAIGFYSFQRDEKQMSYLYLQLVLGWIFEQVSKFRTYQSALQDVVLLTAIPLMTKVFGWRDTTIMIIGSSCHSIARIFFAAARVDWLIYFGGFFGAFGPIVAPVIRSMVSKLVSNNERGKAFSLLSVTDNAIPLFSGIAYNQVYQATIHTNPEAIFYVTITTQVLVLLIGCYIHIRLRSNSLNTYEIEDINNDDKT